MNERYDLSPRYIFDKDEYLRQIGPNARVSYANPFLQYRHTYIPISYGYPQYNNAIGPYDSLSRQHIPLPNEIPNNIDAFMQNAKIFPPVLTSYTNDFKDSSPMPIIMTVTPKDSNEDVKYLETVLSKNKDTPGMTIIEHPGTDFDLIQQILKGKPTPTVPTGQRNKLNGYLKLDTNILSKASGPMQPIISLNNGDGHVKIFPDMRYMPPVYYNLKIQNGAQEILTYAIGLMLSEEYLSADVLQVITGAQNMDLSKLNEIDETQLVKLSNQDIAYLKRYIIKILNVYGLTNYTFKLLEYLYLIEGIPKNEIQMTLKILTDDGVEQNFNRNELQQLKRHLLRIYEDYSESPYILEFLKVILETKFRPSDDDNLPILDIDYGMNNIQNEEQEIISFVKRIMISENKISPDIIKVLNSARNINFSDMNKLVEIRLDHVTDEDLARLKKYLVQVINLYGLTTYTFKLMEYIFILEGRPIIESYLMSLILADNTAVKKFNKDELKLVYEHLLQIHKYYNESPYILAFLKDILDNQFKEVEKEESDSESNDNVIINDAQQKEMQKIYVHLSQTYNNNPNVLNILKIINDIYGYLGADVILPIMNNSDLQSLTTMDSEDLNLLVKYILHVISLRGNNIYVNGLLSYINWIQNSKRDTDVSDSNHKNITSNATEEKIDLSPIYQYLLELDKSNADEGILVILNHLSQNGLPVTTLYSIETLGYGDLIRIKEFLSHNESNELSPTILDFINKLNQAIQKQEVKVIVEGDQLVEITLEDLDVLKQYMKSKQTAVPDYYLNEILQLIKQAQNLKDENGFGKLKYFDLMQIYKYLLQTQGGDIKNPVIIKVQQYVNENNHDINVQKDISYEKPDVNISEIDNIVIDNQVNLEELYNVLLHKSAEDKSNPLLLELLKYFNETLLMPNGKLKIKMLTTNSTKPEEHISQNVLEKLLPFLVNLNENTETEGNYLYAELLKYLKSRTGEKDYDMTKNPLNFIPVDVLYRIKIYLQTFIEKYGKNEPVFQIILQINEILKSKQQDNNPEMMINDFNITKDDLKILLQYLTKFVKMPDSNKDYLTVIEYIIKTEKDIKSQEMYEKNLRVYVMKLINSNDISPAVMDILQFLIINKKDEDPNLIITQLKESPKLDKLKTNEIDELLMYLQQIKTALGPNERLGTLIDNILKHRKAVVTDIQIPEYITIYTEDLKFPGNNMKIINKHLIDLLNQYGKDDDVTHILYKMNRVKEGSDTNNNLIKSIISSNHHGVVMKVDDLRNIITDIINLINNHGTNQVLMKMLRVIFNFNIPQVENEKVSVLGVNDTHVGIAISQKHLGRIKKYFDKIAKDYKLYAHVLNILPIVYPEQNNSTANEQNNTIPNNIHTLVIRHGELSLVTKYILELIRRNGLLPELINVLLFVCDIYDDNKMSFKGNIDNQPNDLMGSEEMRVLFQDGVLHKIQNINADSLKNMYMQLIHKLVESTNYGDNANRSQIIDTLLDMYKKEETPVNKYIIISLLDYFKNNKKINYTALRNPDLVLGLLDIINKPSTVPPNSVDQKDGVLHKIQNISAGSLKNMYMQLIHKLVESTNYGDNANTSQIIDALLDMYKKEETPVNKYIIISLLDYFKNNEKINYEALRNPDLVLGLLDIINKSSTVPPNSVDQKPSNGQETYVTIQPYDYKNDIQGTLRKLVKQMYQQNKNDNYTISKISEDGVRGPTQTKIVFKKILQPIDVNEINKNTVVSYTMNENRGNGIGRRMQPNINVENIHNSIEPTEQNHNIVTEHTLDWINEKEPNIAVEKVFKPIDTNEKIKNTVANHTVYETNEDAIHRRKLLYMKPVNTTEKNENFSANYSINDTNDDGVHGRTQSNINVEKNQERFETEEVNKNIIGNNTIYRIRESENRTEPNIKVEKVFKLIDTNEINKNAVANNTIYQMTKDDIHGPTQPDIKVELDIHFDTANEEKKNIVVNYTGSKIIGDEIQRRMLPIIKVETVTKPIATDEKSKDTVAKYTTEEISEEGIRRRTLPNMKPVDTHEENKNILANYTIHQNATNDEIHGQPESNINVENNHERINTQEHNKNIIGNNTIYAISNDEIHGQNHPNVKVELVQPFDTADEISKNIVVNYTIYKTSGDGVDQNKQPYINIEKTHNPTNLKEPNSTEYTINGNSENEIRRRTESNLKPIDTNKKIVANYTVFEFNGDGTQRRMLPNIKVEKNLKPIATNESTKNIVAKYTFEEIGEDGIRQRIQPNIKPIDTDGKIKNILANNTIYENTIGDETRGRTQSNVNVEDNHERIDTKEQNKNIIGNNTIFQITGNDIHGQTQPFKKVEKLDKPFVTNEKIKNVVPNNTTRRMNKIENIEQTRSNLKEMSCEQANMKFNLILTQLKKASSTNQQQIDLNLEEFLETYDILQKFKNKLSLERHNEISSSVLIKELEQRLLANNMEPCQYEPNIIVKTIISDLVNALRQVIQYMKVNGYDDNRMKTIVVSLVNRLMPDISAIAVQDCEVETPKKLMNLLFSNVYSNKGFEGEEMQFATGYTLQGNSEEDFLHTLSMQKLLQEIAKHKNL